MDAFGSLFVHDGATGQALTLAGGAVKLTGWATKGPSSDDLEGDLSIRPDLATDTIVCEAGGVYQVSVSLSVTSSAAAVVQIHVRAGAVEVAHLAAQVTIGVGANGCLKISGVYRAGADDVTLSVYGEVSADSTLTPVHGNFSVYRIS
jgi:hypothetical protein